MRASEGRLQAFARAGCGPRRRRGRVQETFIGFLTSLPNYDDSPPWKPTCSRSPRTSFDDTSPQAGADAAALPGQAGRAALSRPPARAASSIYRSGERRRSRSKPRRGDRRATAALARRGDWQKIQCAELLFVRGWPNKQVAACLLSRSRWWPTSSSTSSPAPRRRPRAAPAARCVSELYEVGIAVWSQRPN